MTEYNNGIKISKQDRFGQFEDPWHKLISKDETEKLLKIEQNLEEYKNYAKK